MMTEGQFDDDLVADNDDEALSIPKATPTKRRSKAPFAQLRLHWLPILRQKKAERAFPLLTAIAHQIDIGDTGRAAITSQIWAKVGDYSEQERRTMIRALRRVPDIVRLEFRLRTGSKYAAHKGKWFDRAPPRQAG
jgi:hypothetical protein